MLQKLLHSDPKERPSARSLLETNWLVSMISKEEEQTFTNAEHNSESPSKFNSQLAANK